MFKFIVAIEASSQIYQLDPFVSSNKLQLPQSVSLAEIFENALCNAFSTPDELIAVWMGYCDFLLRVIQHSDNPQIKGTWMPICLQLLLCPELP